MVVSIDFDIVMWKDLQLYNDLIRFKDLSKLIEDHPPLNNVRFDLSLYIKMTNFLNKIDKSKIFFVRSHEEMIPYIQDCGIDVELVNIDHHHDVCYDDDFNINNPTCANWVKFLQDTGVVKQYWWIGDSESTPLEKELNDIYISRYSNIEEIFFNEFENVEKVIICLSPQWIPDKFHHYYYRWRDERQGGFNEKDKNV